MTDQANSESQEPDSSGSSACSSVDGADFVCQLALAKFEASIKEWSDAVKQEIALRERPHPGPAINVYNEFVIYGLKMSYAMMQDAMKNQMT